LRRFVPLALTIALLLAILYVFRGEIAVGRLSARLAAVNFAWLVASVPFFLVGFAGAALRFKFIVDRATGTAISFKYLFMLFNFSSVLGYLAPMSIAAEALRVGIIKKHLATTYAKSLRLVVIDKLLGFTGMASIALLFAPLNLMFGIDRILIAVEFGALVGCFLLVPVIAHGGYLLLRRLPGLGPLSAVLGEDWQFIVDNFSGRRDLAFFIMCSLFAVGGFTMGTVLVAAAMHLDGLPTIFVLSPTILLVQNVPLFYAGFGAREAILLLTLKNAFAADPNQVLGFSLLVGVMQFVSAIPGALGFIFRASR
jgi:hypothetical protein